MFSATAVVYFNVRFQEHFIQVDGRIIEYSKRLIRRPNCPFALNNKIYALGSNIHSKLSISAEGRALVGRPCSLHIHKRMKGWMDIRKEGRHSSHDQFVQKWKFVLGRTLLAHKQMRLSGSIPCLSIIVELRGKRQLDVTLRQSSFIRSVSI